MVYQNGDNHLSYNDTFSRAEDQNLLDLTDYNFAFKCTYAFP